MFSPGRKVGASSGARLFWCFSAQMDKKNKFKYKTANVIDNKEYKQINKQ